MRAGRAGIGWFLSALLTSPAAEACPTCKTAAEVRAGIYNGDFARNLGATLLPFGIFLAVAAGIHRYPRKGDAPRGVDHHGAR